MNLLLELLREIEAFIDDRGMAETTFGRLAVTMENLSPGCATARA